MGFVQEFVPIVAAEFPEKTAMGIQLPEAEAIDSINEPVTSDDAWY